jgi:hypothetical protein
VLIKLFQHAKSQGFKPMIERGLEYVASGQSTLEELLRDHSNGRDMKYQWKGLRAGNLR